MNKKERLCKFVDKLERKFSVVDYIKKFAEVKNDWADCPLHHNDTPSLLILRRNGFNYFVCHSCRATGGLITFLMLHQKKSFYEVLEELAKEANIEIPASVKEEIEIYKSRKK